MLSSDPVHVQSGIISVGDDLVVELIPEKGEARTMIDDKDGQPTDLSPWLFSASYGDRIRIKARCAAKWETWRGDPYYNGTKWLSPLYIVDIEDSVQGSTQIFSGLVPVDNGQEDGGVFLDLTYTLGEPTGKWCLSSAPDQCSPVVVDEDMKVISLSGNPALTFDYAPDYNGKGHNRVYDLVLPQGPVDVRFNLVAVNRVNDGGISPLYLFSPVTGRSVTIHPYGVWMSGNCRWFADCPENTVLDITGKFTLPGFPEPAAVNFEMEADYSGEGISVRLEKSIAEPVAIYLGAGDYFLGLDGRWSRRGPLPPIPFMVNDSFNVVLPLPVDTESQKLFSAGRHELTADLPDYHIYRRFEWHEPPSMGDMSRIEMDEPSPYDIMEPEMFVSLVEGDLQKRAQYANPSFYVRFLKHVKGNEEPENRVCKITPLGDTNNSFLDVEYHKVDVAALTFAAMVSCYKETGETHAGSGSLMDVNATMETPPKEFGLAADLLLTRRQGYESEKGQVDHQRMDVVLDHRLKAEYVENAEIFYTTRLHSLSRESQLSLYCNLEWTWTEDIGGDSSTFIQRNLIENRQAWCQRKVEPAPGQVVNPAGEDFRDGLRVVRKMMPTGQTRYFLEFAVDIVDSRGMPVDRNTADDICLAEVWLSPEQSDAPIRDFVTLVHDPVMDPDRPGLFRSGLIDADLIGGDGIQPLADRMGLRNYRYEFRIRHRGERLPGELMRRRFSLGLPTEDHPFIVRINAPERVSPEMNSHSINLEIKTGSQASSMTLSLRFGVWKQGRGMIYLKGLMPGPAIYGTSADPNSLLWEGFHLEDYKDYNFVDIPLDFPKGLFSFRYLGRYVWVMELVNSDTQETLFRKTGPLVIEP